MPPPKTDLKESESGETNRALQPTPATPAPNAIHLGG